MKYTLTGRMIEGSERGENGPLQRRDIAEGSERGVTGDRGVVGERGDEHLHGLWNEEREPVRKRGWSASAGE